jgi:hypothetical protein
VVEVPKVEQQALAAQVVVVAVRITTPQARQVEQTQVVALVEEAMHLATVALVAQVAPAWSLFESVPHKQSKEGNKNGTCSTHRRRHRP